MHPSILGAGLLATALAAAAPPAAATPQPSHGACPAAQAAVQESFIAADCTLCWAAADEADTPPRQRSWRLDWILPGDDAAPMAGAALPDGVERARRIGSVPAAGQQRQAGRVASAALRGLRLHVVSGPAWQGYFGVELSVQRRAGQQLPAGSTAWMALVEPVPAGSEGTAITRALVRTVAGPMPLPAAGGRTLKHLRALRWPRDARPERLQARAWIEGPDGRVLAMAADRCR